ncbi:MAG: DUF1549 domain-containing protein, partial [Planctomycetaceae bacterium]
SEGAEYESHWAFIEPRRAVIPEVGAAHADWSTNEIDRFVLARLEAAQMAPARQADRSTLLRRVSFDLTGLPPTLAETRDFLADTAPDAYERLVDRLLASAAYGERMGQLWLDLARYADTNGYNNDEDRTMWLWREWVIDAFNANLPIDQFIVEQIAGDLLPEPTLEQRVATGFNRNHVITTEGGIIPEEYRLEYVADRVHTTATVFLGLSFQCARCHDHKYDPFSQTDYYRLFAFFNNVADKTVGYNSGAPAEPYLKVVPGRWRRDHEQLLVRRTRLEDQITRHVAAAEGPMAAWEQSLSADDLAKLPAGLIAQFSFDEGEGRAAANVVAADQQAEVNGTPGWSDGKSGKAFDFDGQTHLEAGQLGATERTQPFTFAAWVFPTANEPLTIVSKITDGAGRRGYELTFEGGKLTASLNDDWPEHFLKVETKSLVSTNAWHHVAATYDGSSSAAGLRLFVDGKPHELEVVANKLSGTIATLQPFRIGGGAASAGFKGKIDELLLFSA